MVGKQDADVPNPRYTFGPYTDQPAWRGSTPRFPLEGVDSLSAFNAVLPMVISEGFEPPSGLSPPLHRLFDILCRYLVIDGFPSIP